MDEFLLISFDSTSDAMVGELKVKGENIRARLVPLLPQIDAGCGLALRTDLSNHKKVYGIFENMGLSFKQMYILTYENLRKPRLRTYDLS
ncbi:MAG: DUF3343 domain-containing protein [Anaerococcus sp.]|nr:DUF3343 domain-containing protein [Anaerococcus sp.]